MSCLVEIGGRLYSSLSLRTRFDLFIGGSSCSGRASSLLASMASRICSSSSYRLFIVALRFVVWLAEETRPALVVISWGDRVPSFACEPALEEVRSDLFRGRKLE